MIAVIITSVGGSFPAMYSSVKDNLNFKQSMLVLLNICCNCLSALCLIFINTIFAIAFQLILKYFLMAEVAGFEPAINRVKVYCLAARSHL